MIPAVFGAMMLMAAPPVVTGYTHTQTWSFVQQAKESGEITRHWGMGGGEEAELLQIRSDALWADWKQQLADMGLEPPFCALWDEDHQRLVHPATQLGLELSAAGQECR
jgi:hypothetical protein